MNDQPRQYVSCHTPPSNLDLYTRRIDFGEMCKLCFEPACSPNTHVSFQCPIFQSLPKTRQGEFINRRNRNYHDVITTGALQPPRTQPRSDYTPSSQTAVQHPQPPPSRNLVKLMEACAPHPRSHHLPHNMTRSRRNPHQKN